MALTDLDWTECLRLLSAAAVGRIVFTERALPAIRPVNFLLDGDEIVFRTATGSAVAAATRHAVVAFKVDEINVTHPRRVWLPCTVCLVLVFGTGPEE